ncbi:MAG TPA: phage holin family protein [Pseudomonadales bacterium]|nr:phage holin family protein [Pseudomonadales bacterium]
MPSAPQVPSAFFESLRTLGVSCLSLVSHRVELMVLEFREQQEYGKQLLLSGIACALLLSTTLLLLALWVVIVCWDTHRVLAISGVCVFYMGMSLLMVLQLYRQLRNSPKPFAASLEEFSRDLALLRTGTDSAVPAEKTHE